MLPKRRPSGDDELQTWLYGRFRRPLVAYFHKRIGDRAEAEDLTQEVFVRLLGYVSLEAVENADAFVFKVASNLLHDRGRCALRQPQPDGLALDPEETDELAKCYVEDCGPERVLLGREALGAALKALDELDERTRNIFILSRVERMKQRDIAVLYGISASTVEKEVMRAMIHLVSRVGKVGS